MWLFNVWFLFSAFVIDVISLNTSPTKDSSCSYETDMFSLWWMNDGISSDIVFKMMARSKNTNFWAGFFIGDEKPIDAIGAFVQNNRISLMDGHVTANGMLQMDDVTNVQYLMVDQQDHVLMAEFTRPSITNDSSDADLSKCITFFLPSDVIKMDAYGKVMIPQQLTRRHVCNIAKTCNNRQTGFVKRSDSSVCEYTKGMNTVTWKTVGDNVEFTIGQNAKRGKWWSAIGVGEGMENMKTAIAFMENGIVKSVGGYQTQGYKVPKADPLVNPVLNTMESKVNKGRSFVNFAIPMKIFDLYTDKTGCVTLQIAVLAGQWTNKYEVKKHERTPEGVLVCGIEHCSDMNTALAFAIDDAPVVEEKDTGSNTILIMAANDTDNNVLEASGESSGEEIEGSGLEEGSAEFETEVVATNKTVSTVAETNVLTEEKKVISANEDIAEKKQSKTKTTTAPTVIKLPSGTPLVLTKTLTDEVSKIIHEGCAKDHTDLFICEAYFNNYLYEVANWAKEHNQILEEHMWKACMLLSLVERVPSSCCTKFETTCGSFLEFMRSRI